MRSFPLHVVTHDGTRIEGTWQDGSSECTFTYTRDYRTGYFDGVYKLSDGFHTFYEYGVKFLVNEEDGFTGRGVNRYGEFTIKGSHDSTEWVKTYTVWFKAPKPSPSAIVDKRRREIARWIRVVFKDRYWKLERSVLYGRKNEADVRKELEHDEHYVDYVLHATMLNKTRRDVLFMRRKDCLTKLGTMEAKVVHLENLVRRLRMRVAPYKKSPLYRSHHEKLRGSTFPISLFNEWEGGPVYGTTFLDANTYQVRWQDISDELVEYLVKKAAQI
jgi:hypothetical protein